MKIEIIDLGVTSLCEHFRHGAYFSQISHFSHIFEGGKIYHIDSDFFDGGWALSYFLCGYTEPEKTIHKNTITLSGFDKEIKSLKDISCYIGHPSNNYLSAKKSLFWIIIKKYFTIRYELNKALKEYDFKISLKDFCEEYFMEEERLDRSFDHLSGSIWRYSISLGIAQNKQIFCFPQMPMFFMNTIMNTEIMKKLLLKLKELNKIVIIPTKYPDNIIDLIDEKINVAIYNDNSAIKH